MRSCGFHLRAISLETSSIYPWSEFENYLFQKTATSTRSQWVNSLRPSDAYIVGKLTIISSDNGLSPGRRQAIIWTNAGILLIRPLGTNFSGILIGNQTFSFKKMHLEMSSAKWRLFYLGLSVNKLRLRQNGHHVADGFLKFIMLYENYCILIKILPKFIPEGLINNDTSLVQIMAWRRSGAKPLSEPMMVSLLMHIYASLGLNELNWLVPLVIILILIIKILLFFWEKSFKNRQQATIWTTKWSGLPTHRCTNRPQCVYGLVPRGRWQ